MRYLRAAPQIIAFRDRKKGKPSVVNLVKMGTKWYKVSSLKILEFMEDLDSDEIRKAADQICLKLEDELKISDLGEFFS